ncbi:MAG: clan AA aspartic protease [Bacteroidetes bacterium]|nr:clan AA aspartic protease [Bacteroidota bacterium]
MIHKIPIEIIPIEEEGFHLMINAVINGQKANLLIDTGASRSVFDIEKIKKYIGEDQILFEKNEKLSTGLGTNTMESQSVIIDELKLGDLIIHNYQAVVLEMSHINQSYAKLNLPGIDGVMGGDLFYQYKVVIDYKRKSLKLYSL